MIRVLGALLLLSAAGATAATPPPIAEHEFHFVVLGDSQFHDPATFNRLVDDVERLSPALIVQVGDMIEGYRDNLEDTRTEWQRFRRQVEPILDRFVPVAGNHDVYGGNKSPSAPVTELYESIWGPSYHTFAYRNARFFILNTDLPDAQQRIDGAQRQWLERALKAATEPHRFVFMHRPPRSLDKAEALHRLFVEHDVSHVFYGHHHHYHFYKQDGIRYVMTNAAARSDTGFVESGNFHHLVQVSVRDEDVRMAVIKADAIFPEDAVAPFDNYDLFGLHRRLLAAPPVVRRSGDQRWSATVQLNNPTARNLTAYVQCASPDDRWQVTPRQIPPLSLGSNGTVTLELEWSYASAAIPEGTPYCKVQIPVQTAHGVWLQHEDSVAFDDLSPAD